MFGASSELASVMEFGFNRTSVLVDLLLHRESKKGCHPNHGYNFVSSLWIGKFLSLLQRAVNFQQNEY